MMDKKMYKDLEPKNEMMVEEPVITYEANYVMNNLEVISSDTMQCLVNSAMEDFRANRCTSHTEMNEFIKNRMEWK